MRADTPAGSGPHPPEPDPAGAFLTGSKMHDEHPLSRFLHKKIFSTAARDHFAAQYVDDVDPEGFRVDETTETHTSTDDTGTMTVYVVHNGIAVAHFVAADDLSKKWAAFETKDRVQQRALHGRWADF